MRNDSNPRTALVRFALGLVSLTLALAAVAAAGPVHAPPKLGSDREQIEKCLIEIYVAQTSYFAEQNKYGGNRRVLGVSEDGYCKGLKLSFKNVKAETFVVTAESLKESWMINETKEIFKLK